MTLTCGPKAGSILYKVGIGSASFKSGFGLLDINEGIQDIYYGWNGDIDTETINYLKDVLGEKAYNNIEKYATITMDFTMFADFVLAVDSWVNGFGMLSGETEMAGEMTALESLENVELAEIESVELANAETVTIETVEGEVVEIEAVAECGSSIGEAGLVENEIKGGSNSIRDLMLQSESSKKWGILDDGTNQGVKHFADYWERYPERIPSLEQRLGVNVGDFSNSLEGFENFTKQAERVIDDAVANGNVRNINGKSIYYMDGIANPKKGVVVIVKDGKMNIPRS